MTNSQLQLLALVKLAIHPSEDIAEVLLKRAIDWNEILDQALKQSIVGIAYAGMKNLISSKTDCVKPIDKKLLTKWFGAVEKIRHENLLLNKRR